MDDELKERIYRYVTSIPEIKIKIGCSVLAIIGLFVFLFVVNLFFLGGLPAVGAFGLAVLETVLAALILALFAFNLKFLDSVLGKFGFLYHGGTREYVVKPEIHLARNLQNKRDYTGAIKEYRKLLVAFPERIDFLFEIGEIYRKDLNDTERALKAYHALAQNPETGRFAYLVKQAKHRIEELEGRTYVQPKTIEIE